MKFDAPAGSNPIDQLKVVGRATDRIDGPLKTTGQATYAYEQHAAAPDAAYGYIVAASIPTGRIKSMDLSRARAAPGVITIVTAENSPKLGKSRFNTARLLGGPEIEHYHQAIALVVAESFEQARTAANLVRVDYVRAKGSYDLAAVENEAQASDEQKDVRVGDFETAFDAAPVQLDARYTTPDHSHAMMEPHASIAAWNGEQLTLWTSNQMVNWGVGAVAETLGIAPANVRLVAPYIGGGFGAKLFVRADAVLAALGARAARRPVKVSLQRPLIFNNTTHRPATIQRLRLGAGADGRLSAFSHQVISGDLPGGGIENSVQQSRLLYAAPNRLITARLAVLNLPEGNAMRAPGEASGLMALEIAMDELAEKLGMDPVQLRIVNDTQVDPENPDRPFSQRNLVQCLQQGAERFGWAARPQKPASRREGQWLIGMGMAVAFRNNLLRKSAGRVRLDRDGIVTVQTDMTDIGTGSYTIIAQTAAETLGLPLQQVRVELGDSRFPASAGSGGQWGAANSTAGVYAACMKLRGMVAARLGMNAETAVFSGGQVIDQGRSLALADAVREGELLAEDTIEYGDIARRAQQSTFGGHFVEVHVHAFTGEIRVQRMLAVCSAGRILNPKPARSQVIGAMTMGVGAALMEELVPDTRLGFFVNHDLASYEVPVHADIPHQEVVFLDETDPMSTPMKAKGVGELGLCGVAAAVANAVYNATGVRVREYPVTLDKLIGQMPLAT